MLIIAQIKSPILVGMIIASKVHFTLFVSFLIVRQVVEHGKCMREKITVQTAVIIVQPLSVNSALKSARLSSSISEPVERYAIIIIGKTISLAGNPRIKANKITPSSPKNCANGSKKSEQYFNKLISATFKFSYNFV